VEQNERGRQGRLCSNVCAVALALEGAARRGADDSSYQGGNGAPKDTVTAGMTAVARRPQRTASHDDLKGMTSNPAAKGNGEQSPWRTEEVSNPSGIKRRALPAREDRVIRGGEAVTINAA